jgi:hypothetical protein
VCKVKDGKWTIGGSAWPEGKSEPNKWMLSLSEEEEPVAGRASVLGSPFSGTPIWFDDLMVEQSRVLLFP